MTTPEPRPWVPSRAPRPAAGDRLDPRHLVLARDPHPSGDGLTVMEAVACLAGEPRTERPECASPILTDWMIALGQALDDEARQELRSYIWRLVDSRGEPRQEATRQWMVLDWFVRVSGPIWLHAVQLGEHAKRLAALTPIGGSETLAAARPAAEAAARAGRAANGTAWSVVAADAQPEPWRVAPASAERAVGSEGLPVGTGVWPAVEHAVRYAARAAHSPLAAAERATGYHATRPLDTPPAWRGAIVTVTDSAEAIAWRAVRRLTDDGRWSWHQPAGDAWRAAVDVARPALEPSEINMRGAAHVLTDQMLAVNEKTGGRT